MNNYFFTSKYKCLLLEQLENNISTAKEKEVEIIICPFFIGNHANSFI